MQSAYLLFHLNLAFSAIEAESRLDVINKCYYPILELAKNFNIKLAIEATGWTLEQIQDLSPHFIDELILLIHAKKIELVGSGYMQIIGPLVSHQANIQNQLIGKASYMSVLGITPKIVLVNEMAYSSSMVDLYLDANYEAFIMEANNIAFSLGLEGKKAQLLPHYATGLKVGNKMPVIWADSLLFQKFQNYIHGQISQIEYLDYLKKQIGLNKPYLPIYSSDAEIFDYRPRRFGDEGDPDPQGEWTRIKLLLKYIDENKICNFILPSDLLGHKIVINELPQKLSSIVYPVPVKKQSQYNITRWAVSGRNDLWANSICHRISEKLCEMDISGQNTSEFWRRLCYLWGSDFRTHITELRWMGFVDELINLSKKVGVSSVNECWSTDEENRKFATNSGINIEENQDGNKVIFETPYLQLKLCLKHSVSIESLAFKIHGFKAIIGNLLLGSFQSIALASNFYSMDLLIQSQSTHSTVSLDGGGVKPEIIYGENSVKICSILNTKFGRVQKIIEILEEEEAVYVAYEFSGWNRSDAIIRAGSIVALVENFSENIFVTTKNGGSEYEKFILDVDCDHTRSANALVSSMGGMGATSGELLIYDESGYGIKVSWDPKISPVMPMIIHQRYEDDRLLQIWFSIQEIDETFRGGGSLPGLRMKIEPLKQGFE
jgi:hypothetical protein